MKSIREIAVGLSSSTIASAKRALKEAGMKQALAPEVLEAKAAIDAARAAKWSARARRLLGSQRIRLCKKPVMIPSGTPAQRLEELRKTTIKRAFISAFRQPAHGETKVVLTDDPAKVGVIQVDRDDWNVYAKSYKHGPAKCLDNTIIVPATWRTRVEKLGIAILDGMMTLDAQKVEGAPAGVQLFAATWASQGRGNSVNVSNGFIATAGGLSYHADCAERALAGLKRKAKNAEWQAKIRNMDIPEIIRRLPDLVVRLADAKAIGACEYGIRSWCARVGISYEAGEATVSEVWAGYCAVPAPEARAALLHAARRNRKHLRIAA